MFFWSDSGGMQTSVENTERCVCQISKRSQADAVRFSCCNDKKTSLRRFIAVSDFNYQAQKVITHYNYILLFSKFSIKFKCNSVTLLH